MSNVRINRIECDSCNTTVDIPEGDILVPGATLPSAGWTHVSVETNPNEDHAAINNYFDLCDDCTDIFSKNMSEFLEQWGK